MTDIDVHHLAAAYALDALDDRERSAFEAHYGACEVCRTDVLEFRHTLTHVAESLAAAPPMSLKDKVMAEVATTRQLSPLVAPVVALDSRRRTRSLMSMAAVAAAMVMLVVGVVSFSGADQKKSYASDLAYVLEQPDSRMVSLDSQGGAQGTFRVAWSKSLGEAVLMGENLPSAPDDMAYELWLVTPEKKMAMSVLDGARDGNVHQTLKASADPTGWAITVEPAAGSATATGNILFLASV